MSYLDHSKFRKAVPARLDQRCEERHPVILQKARLRGKPNLPEEARLMDISSYGCRLKVSQSYRAGTLLKLGFFERDPITARAVWCRDGEMGCRFDEAIDFSLFRALTIRAV